MGDFDVKEVKKNNKPLIALLLLAIVGVVGVTIAYFTSNATLENIFKTAPYSTQVEEEFTSPTNWTPGTTTPKTVVAKNTGDVPVAVRVSIEEEWVSGNGESLPLEQNGNKAAIINFANTSDWTLVDGYYYYNKKLSKDESTSSFLQSVKFNEKIEIDLRCSTTGDDSFTSSFCTTSGSGYDGATYTLTVKVETVQFDAYKTFWNTTATITE